MAKKEKMVKTIAGLSPAEATALLSQPNDFDTMVSIFVALKEQRDMFDELLSKFKDKYLTVETFKAAYGGEPVDMVDGKHVVSCALRRTTKHEVKASVHDVPEEFLVTSVDEKAIINAFKAGTLSADLKSLVNSVEGAETLNVVVRNGKKEA